MIAKSINNNNNHYNADYLITIMMFWVFLHAVYEKCFHILLRRSEYPFIKRKRIIDGFWKLVFAVESIFYLQQIHVPFIIKIINDKNSPNHNDVYTMKNYTPRSILHDTFYLHCSMIELFINGSKLQGWIYFLLFIIAYYWRTLDIVDDILLYKASNLLIICTCKILYSVMSNKKGKLFLTKALLGLHFSNCVRTIYITAIADNSKISNRRTVEEDLFFHICILIWLFSELFVTEICNFCSGYQHSGRWIEGYLFPSALKLAVESKQLKTICLKIHKVPDHNNPQNEAIHESKDKTAQLVQTLYCAMILKKKLRKYRETKDNNSKTTNNEYNDETQSDE